MALHPGHDLIVVCQHTSVRLIAAKLNVIDGCADLLIRRSGFAASSDKLPHKLGGGHPFLIVAPAEAAPVPLIPVQQRKADCLFLTG